MLRRKAGIGICVIISSCILLGTAAAAGQQAVQKAPAPASDWQSQREIQLHEDWGDLKHFSDQNGKLPPPSASVARVVFMGDSITEGWKTHGVPSAAEDTTKDWVNRGISGQTTPQMLVRFRPDVIALKPAVVVILAGINDIAGNTGDMTLEQTENNLASMADLAQANGIRVVLCSVMPAFDFPWKPGRQPAPKVIELNKWIKAFAASKGYVYVDYYSAMADDRGGMPKSLSGDGVHPNPAGYAIMTPLAEAGIAKALAGK
jgi:lysophospholipase L1-like esterase